MANITPAFLQLLQKEGVTTIGDHRSPSGKTDDFLKEAYRIYSHIRSLRTYLRSIRQPYLSASQPFRRHERRGSSSVKAPHLADGPCKSLTDRQRDQIDAESKQLLRDVNTAIQNLSEAERLRQKARSTLAQRKRATGPFGGLRVWAAGRSDTGKTPLEELEDAQAGMLSAHHESMLWYLRRQLEDCSELQMTMMEIRLTWEMERSKSRLYGAHASTTFAPMAGGSTLEMPSGDVGSAQSGLRDGISDVASVENVTSEFQLSHEQQQLLAEENQDMLKHYEDTLDQVRTAERSLINISELQTTLANNLAVQAAHVDQLVADTLTTTENVGGGNKQLKRAAERKSTAKYVFYASCSFSVFLVVYDFLI